MATTGGLVFILLVWGVTAALAILFWRKAAGHERALARFQKIVDIEAHIAQAKAAFEQHQRLQMQGFEEQIAGQRAGFERLQQDRKREVDEHIAKQRTELDRCRMMSRSE